MSNSLKDTLLISLSAVAFMIGVHRTIVEGLYENYWIFMISLGLFMWYRYSRKTASSPPGPGAATATKPAKKKKQK